ncbi:hypothetical protein D3C85_1354640 [compost metagenome]
MQGLQFLRAAPSTLARLGAQLVQEAAHLVDAGAVASGLGDVFGIGRFDAGLGWALIAAQEGRRPGGDAHVRLRARRCQAGFAVFAEVGEPAHERALGEGAVAGLAVVGTRQLLGEVGAELAVTG